MLPMGFIYGIYREREREREREQTPRTIHSSIKGATVRIRIF